MFHGNISPAYAVFPIPRMVEVLVQKDHPNQEYYSRRHQQQQASPSHQLLVSEQYTGTCFESHQQSHRLPPVILALIPSISK